MSSRNIHSHLIKNKLNCSISLWRQISRKLTLLKSTTMVLHCHIMLHLLIITLKTTFPGSCRVCNQCP
ncbi:hypothetical protein CICLE_v10017415mg [Citrus x clementina]|uniref:Uncharacterized protein n=1 Tax=Citrus clementina TaxID=85681 RepID=V4TGJ7_CITCL|nr:hypothetical protein CICLE_v10017415mg [Citrus x clementina]